MAQPALGFMGHNEFFEFLQSQEMKWELVDGQPIMMAGANQRHQAIAMNTSGSLFAKLRGSPCRPTTADTGVASSGGNVRYPDVVVDCGPRDDTSMLASEPTVVIEVFSPSTKGFDSQRKLIEYKKNPAINCILLIDTDNACTILHRRTDGGWSETVYQNIDDVIDLPEIGTSLSLQEIYAGLEFKPQLTISQICPKCRNIPCICNDSGAHKP